MAQCTFLDRCRNSFFSSELAEDRIMTNIIKSDFCMHAAQSCARLKLYKKLGETGVPSDFYPYQREDANKLIDKNSPT
jgi:hypothetical protein